MFYQFYTRLVHSAQAVCVSVYLQLAPDQRLPAACEDAYATFLWLCSVARALSDGATKYFPITCPMGPLAAPLGNLKLPRMLVAVAVAEMDLIRDSELESCEAMKEAGKHGRSQNFSFEAVMTKTNIVGRVIFI
ncbi:hypothetical protein Ddye_011872 [Dipteronia dyeriana]|uniref:Alpha/beta hydrolase fold-3 domain-containing protein n=1 Tax=Dipteronia dyeriana TaxID=168575 RepID=A0AAE0CHR4_9ROSI|nr:hypothetical protein Ddye_011872 [Dipteronia dyeriana]